MSKPPDAQIPECKSKTRCEAGFFVSARAATNRHPGQARCRGRAPGSKLTLNVDNMDPCFRGDDESVSNHGMSGAGSLLDPRAGSLHDRAHRNIACRRHASTRNSRCRRCTCVVY